jgi:hypothetical protein
MEGVAQGWDLWRTVMNTATTSQLIHCTRSEIFFAVYCYTFVTQKNNSNGICRS